MAYLVIVGVTGALLFITKDRWLPMVQQQRGVSTATTDDHAGHGHGDDGHSHGADAGHNHAHQGHRHAHTEHSHGDHGHSHGGAGHAHDHGTHSHGDDGVAGENAVELSDQAKRNLKLSSKRAYPQSFWKRTEIPGEIVDRPGLTDRSLTSPIAGVITAVHAQQGDIIKPGDRLVTIRLVSDYLQQVQSDLFKAVRETEIVNTEIARIQTMVERGIVPEKRVIQLRQDVERQRSQIDAIYQDLVMRGFSDAQVANAKQGKFLTSIEIKAPIKPLDSRQAKLNLGQSKEEPAKSQFFEVHELVSELGHQVRPGEQIAVLSDHQHLFIRGHAFKREAGILEQVMEKGWSVGVEFVDDVPENWPNLNQRFKIRHLTNEVDPESRTFDFIMPMENQSRIYGDGDRTSIVWRFRPGQRVRLQIPVEKIEGVLVLPAAAVVRDGAEVYAFQASGRFYRRFPVHLLYQDRHNVVLANDGSLPVGAEVAQGAAASLNRILKSQTNEGGQEFHVHADGTVHSNSDH